MEPRSLKRFEKLLFAFPLMVCLLLRLPPIAWGENQIEKCNNEPTAENCEKIIELPIFCTNTNNVKLYLGGYPGSNLLLITLESTSSSPLNKSGFFYAANGRLRDGAVKEVKIANATCASINGIHTCKGSLTAATEKKLSSTFDFDQEVLSILLRDDKLRDVCMGKLANDETLLTTKGRLNRQFCEFTPAAAYKNTSGAGFFDPKGYGISGESLLHIAFEGLPTGKTIRGCSQLGNSYQEVFSISSYDVEKGDAEIYGSLSADEQTTLARQGLEYSYDLYRELEASSGTISSFSQSLSLLNRQISSNAASTETRESNQKFEELKRAQKKKKQEQKTQNSRTLPFSRFLSMASIDRASANKSSDVFQWLAFDPNGGGDVILAPSCSSKSISNNSYGIVSCNAPNSAKQSCSSLTSIDSTAATKGNACFEQRNGYLLATFRIEGAPDGAYYICNKGSLVSNEALNVSTDAIGSFGELQVTNNSLAAQRVPGLVEGAIDGLVAITIDSAKDCLTPILQSNS